MPKIAKVTWSTPLCCPWKILKFLSSHRFHQNWISRPSRSLLLWLLQRLRRSVHQSYKEEPVGTPVRKWRLPRDKTLLHTSLLKGQSLHKCRIVSGAELQRQQIGLQGQPLFWRLSAVSILLCSTVQAKVGFSYSKQQSRQRHAELHTPGRALFSVRIQISWPFAMHACMHTYITTPQNHGELIITNTNLTNAIYSR